MSLADRSCAPCPAGTPPLSSEVQAHLAGAVPLWTVEGDTLTRTFRLASFPDAIRLVDEIAALAESEQHHPDLAVRYDRVRVDLSTHSVRGLSENDFILAAKIDRVASRLGRLV